MPANPTPYPDAATVEAVRQSLGWRHDDGAHIGPAVIAKILLAARRGEQEQARKRFERELVTQSASDLATTGKWRDPYWRVYDSATAGDVASVMENGTIIAFWTPPADLRALAAYIESQDWSAPTQEGN